MFVRGAAGLRGEELCDELGLAVGHDYDAGLDDADNRDADGGGFRGTGVRRAAG